MHNPSWTVARISSIGSARSVWIGIGVFVTYLIANVLTVVLMFRTTIDQIPEHLASAYAQVLTIMQISTSAGVLFGDIITLVLGWVFIVIAVTLMSGRRSYRALFGWLCIGHLPLVVYSTCFAVLLGLFSDVLAYKGLASIATIDQLPIELAKMQDTGWFAWIRYGRYLAYAFTLAFACEAVHRVNALPRLRSIGILSAYAFIHVFITMFVS